ncbi:hypothetical protein HanHA89_Chr01g0009151 [Helianthus annuus]|nr:hypothetical protein HanHA89_Chr01g0009151 [Helianthus annuus]
MNISKPARASVLKSILSSVNCGEQTKVKTTEILKLMNEYKNKLGCFNSRHYKYLRKFNPMIFAFLFVFLFFFVFNIYVGAFLFDK